MASRACTVFVRSLCTSPATNQLVKAPIKVFGIEGRYAAALFSAGSKMKNLDTIEKEMVQLQSFLKTEPKFREFLINPVLRKPVKVEAVKQICAKLNMTPATTNMLAVAAEHSRLKRLEGIIFNFKRIMAAHRGEVECEVTTAKPLDEATKKELETALLSFMGKGEKLLLTTSVDPSIIGGMIVVIGDKYVDMSIASKVKKFTQVLQAAA